MDPIRAISDDGILAKQYLAGDGDAFRLLLEQYSHAIFHHAFRFTGNKDDAEDIAQETFIRLHEHIATLDLSMPLKPWLYKVCTNLCRNFAQKKRNFSFSELEHIDDESDDTHSFADTIASGEQAPDQAIAQSEQIDLIRDALKKLPPKYRVVLALFYFDGLSYEEIADALELPINTIRTHLRRAKSDLQSLLPFDVS